jgi:hypothetical protein
MSAESIQQRHTSKLTVQENGEARWPRILGQTAAHSKPGVYTRSLALFTPHQVWPDPPWLLPPFYSCGGFLPSPAALVLPEGLHERIWETGRLA